MKKMTNMKKWIVGVVLMLTTIVGVGQEDCISREIWYKDGKKITSIYNPCQVLEYRNPGDVLAYNVGIYEDSLGESKKKYRVYISTNCELDNPYIALGIDENKKYITPDGYKILITPSIRKTIINNEGDPIPYMEFEVSKEVLALFKEGKVKDFTIYHTWNRDNHKDPVIKCGNYFKDFIAKY